MSLKSDLRIRENYLRKVGANLLAIRKSQSLSQEEFAKKLGVSLRAYGSYERGEREMTIFLVEKIQIITKMNPLLDEKTAFSFVPTYVAKVPATVRQTTWLSRLSDFRGAAIAAREAFESANYSSGRRVLFKLRDAVQFGSSLALCFRLYVPENVQMKISPTNYPDELLVLNFAIMLIALFFQLIYLGKFYMFQRQNRLS